LRNFKAQSVMLLPVDFVLGFVPFDTRQSHAISVIQNICFVKPLFCVYMSNPERYVLIGLARQGLGSEGGKQAGRVQEAPRIRGQGKNDPGHGAISPPRCRSF
jgi:hypothetical protein